MPPLRNVKCTALFILALRLRFDLWPTLASRSPLLTLLFLSLLPPVFFFSKIFPELDSRCFLAAPGFLHRFFFPSFPYSPFFLHPLLGPFHPGSQLPPLFPAFPMLQTSQVLYCLAFLFIPVPKNVRPTLTVLRSLERPQRLLSHRLEFRKSLVPSSVP